MIKTPIFFADSTNSIIFAIKGIAQSKPTQNGTVFW
jgi:hypothetical protein